MRVLDSLVADIHLPGAVALNVEGGFSLFSHMPSRFWLAFLPVCHGVQFAASMRVEGDGASFDLVDPGSTGGWRTPYVLMLGRFHPVVGQLWNVCFTLEVGIVVRE